LEEQNVRISATTRVRPAAGNVTRTRQTEFLG
jgi:hypothetical protein